MTIPEPQISLDPQVEQIAASDVQQERKRRLMLLALLMLLLSICAVLVIFANYLLRPAPLPDILPGVISQNINYPPTYKFSIPAVDGPVGVAVSPDGQRIYVTESGGERLIKLFNRDGTLINSFASPGTTASNRKPTYLAVDAQGRVFVSENYNHVINVFDPDGNFIDSLIGPEMSMSEVLAAELGGTIPPGTLAFFNNINKQVYYQLPDEETKSFAPEDFVPWGPLGLRFDAKGNLLVTNIVAGKHGVLVYPPEALSDSFSDFKPQVLFGEQGNGDGQLSFPNSVVADSQGNFYVSDGNNARISAWTADREYRAFFGFGSGENALNLPRGMWMDGRDRLHVADVVGQFVRVYDVSGAEPAFLFSFGNFGLEDGLFNSPTDIAIDSGGRLYITDRENNRVQIWSY